MLISPIYKNVRVFFFRTPLVRVRTIVRVFFSDTLKEAGWQGLFTQNDLLQTFLGVSTMYGFFVVATPMLFAEIRKRGYVSRR